MVRAWTHMELRLAEIETSFSPPPLYADCRCRELDSSYYETEQAALHMLLTMQHILFHDVLASKSVVFKPATLGLQS